MAGADGIPLCHHRWVVLLIDGVSGAKWTHIPPQLFAEIDRLMADDDR